MNKVKLDYGVISTICGLLTFESSGPSAWHCLMKSEIHVARHGMSLQRIEVSNEFIDYQKHLALCRIMVRRHNGVELSIQFLTQEQKPMQTSNRLDFDGGRRKLRKRR